VVILTLKERKLIDEAIFTLGNDHDVTVWREWKRNHPEVNYPGSGRNDDGTGPMPGYVIEVVVSALTRFAGSLEQRTKTASPDEAADLCNDILDIESTAQTVRAG
jgi:hypothetical protein